MKRFISTLIVLTMLGMAGSALATDSQSCRRPNQPGCNDITSVNNNFNTLLNGNENNNRNANSNRNDNKNTNMNLNNMNQGQSQGQAQGQGQAMGQGQGQSQSSFSEGSSASSSSNNSLELTFEDAPDFAPTLGVPTYVPGKIQYTPAELNKVRGFVSLMTLKTLLPTINVDGMVENYKMNHSITLFREGNVGWEPDMIFRLGEAGGETIAIGTVWADGKDISSVQILREAARFCSKEGASAILGISQQDTTSMASSGWGIGLGYNAAGINNSGDISQVGSGGTGYSSASAAYVHKLSLEFACIK